MYLCSMYARILWCTEIQWKDEISLVITPVEETPGTWPQNEYSNEHENLLYIIKP